MIFTKQSNPADLILALNYLEYDSKQRHPHFPDRSVLKYEAKSRSKKSETKELADFLAALEDVKAKKRKSSDPDDLITVAVVRTSQDVRPLELARGLVDLQMLFEYERALLRR